MVLCGFEQLGSYQDEKKPGTGRKFPSLTVRIVSRTLSVAEATQTLEDTIFVRIKAHVQVATLTLIDSGLCRVISSYTVVL